MQNKIFLKTCFPNTQIIINELKNDLTILSSLSYTTNGREIKIIKEFLDSDLLKKCKLYPNYPIIQVTPSYPDRFVHGFITAKTVAK